jgi:hypothetical protein
MVENDLIQANLNVRKLKLQINRLINWLKVERATNRARMTTINGLEKNLIDLGHGSEDK